MANIAKPKEKTSAKEKPAELAPTIPFLKTVQAIVPPPSKRREQRNSNQANYSEVVGAGVFIGPDIDIFYQKSACNHQNKIDRYHDIDEHFP